MSWQPSWNWIDGIVPHIPVLQAGGCNGCRPSVFHRYSGYEPMRECCYNKWQFRDGEGFWFFALMQREIERESCRYG